MEPHAEHPTWHRLRLEAFDRESDPAPPADTETLVIAAEGEQDTAGAFCPVCGTFCDRNAGAFEIDDYVGSNCLMWCPFHREVLVCASGLDDDGDLRAVVAGEVPRNRCLERLTAEEARAYARHRGFDLAAALAALRVVAVPVGAEPEGDEVDPADARFFRVGVVHVSRFGRVGAGARRGEEGDVAWGPPFGAVPNFGALPPGVDARHDGPSLHYRGACAKCGAAHASSIWGD